jgi:ATP-dependent DNA helicase RecQ
MHASPRSHTPPADRTGARRRARTPARRPAARRGPELRQLLQDTFGLARLRPGQEAVIAQVLDGRDVFAVMPTGAGKSLCYQLPAVLEGGMTLVVSPLISLMTDQCDKLHALGIQAVALNSAQGAAEEREALAAIEAGSVRLLFTTPERLSRDDALIATLARATRSGAQAEGPQPVRLLVIDEAHCISQWGHDFRPAFLELSFVRRALGAPPVLALSATAPPDVIDDVAHQLGVDFAVINTGIYRPNLRYRVESFASEDKRLDRLVELVAATPGSGIVYAVTVRAAERAHALLARRDESIGLYHARRPAHERHDVQERFMAGELRVVVATSAFGLGIDKPDIRFVIHCQMPASLDVYYQESGRAGRDGEAAECTLLYLARDRSVQSFFMAGRYPSAADLRGLYRALLEPPPAAEGETGAWTQEALERVVDLPKSHQRVLLALLRERRVIAVDRRRHFRLLRRDLDPRALEQLLEEYRDRAQRDHEMLERMIYYARCGRCRWRVLFEHFEEEAPFEFCGICDSCQLRQRVEAGELSRPRPSAADTR